MFSQMARNFRAETWELVALTNTLQAALNLFDTFGWVARLNAALSPFRNWRFHEVSLSVGSAEEAPWTPKKVVQLMRTTCVRPEALQRSLWVGSIPIGKHSRMSWMAVFVIFVHDQNALCVTDILWICWTGSLWSRGIGCRTMPRIGLTSVCRTPNTLRLPTHIGFGCFGSLFNVWLSHICWCSMFQSWGNLKIKLQSNPVDYSRASAGVVRWNWKLPNRRIQMVMLAPIS